MELDKIIKTIADLGAEYVRAFVSVLVSPEVYFAHAATGASWSGGSPLVVDA